MAIHPIETTRIIRDTYIRYLRTIKPFQDEGLRREFANALDEHNMLVRGPLIQVALPYRPAETIEDLVKEGTLSPLFERLCSKALPFTRKLYVHQVNAIRKAVNQRNLVVSTGTGSGKTEAFLIPILNYLLREQESNGAWFGRWGTNYIYGTWSVLEAFRLAKFDMQHKSVRHAVHASEARCGHRDAGHQAGGKSAAHSCDLPSHRRIRCALPCNSACGARPRGAVDRRGTAAYIPRQLKPGCSRRALLRRFGAHEQAPPQ